GCAGHGGTPTGLHRGSPANVVPQPSVRRKVPTAEHSSGATKWPRVLPLLVPVGGERPKGECNAFHDGRDFGPAVRDRARRDSRTEQKARVRFSRAHPALDQRLSPEA